MSTTYIITGANKGIGRALAEIILARPNHNLFAFVRDPAHETSQSLLAHPKAANSTVAVVQYDASKPESAAQACAELQSKHNVTTVDVVIANAGMMGRTGRAVEISAGDLTEVFNTNTVGPIVLFDAALPLLRQSSSPKFVAVSSGVGSSTLVPKMGHISRQLPYGVSKAALNHAVCKMNQDYDEITFLLLAPGATKTGFGGDQVDWSKIPNVNEVSVVAPGLMQAIDEVVKTKDGEYAMFKKFDGSIVPW